MERKNLIQRQELLRTYKPYKKQREFHRSAVRERLFMAGNQLGKELKFDEPVLTPTGWKQISDLRVGDSVIAGDGSVTTVTGHYPQGVKPLVEIEFCTGTKIAAGFEHLWKALPPGARFKTSCRSFPRVKGKPRQTEMVDNTRFDQWGTYSTGQMVAAYGYAPRPKYRFAVPSVGPVQFGGGELPIDPYVLGLLLGDGGLTNGVQFSSADVEMVAALEVEADKFGCDIICKSPYDYRASTRTRGKNLFKDALCELGVFGCGAADKRVPSSYLLASPADRLAVLQGLMDTDGTCEKSGNMSFTSISEGLTDDVAFLARSFGAKCKIKSRITSYPYKGEKKQGKRSYTVVIRLPEVPIFRLKRKLDRCVRPTSTSDHHIIVGFKDIEPAEAYCISVSHPDKTYVTRDFIVTHNTVAGAAEWAMHLTGEYPDWWDGFRFDRAITVIAGSESYELTRDGVQRLLIGPPASEAEWGTGYIPARCIKRTTRRMGVSNALDTVTVTHVSGGTSTLLLKAYEQGRGKWQANTVDGIWFDEEPPPGVYFEGITRTNITQGPITVTFTPLKGVSTVVARYMNEESPDRAVITMTIDDAEHYTPEQRQKIIDSYPPNERDARTRGVPIMGSGLIYPIAWEDIEVKPFPIPDYWPRAYALDVGWNRTACLWGAWDPSDGCCYLYSEHYRGQELPAIHAAAIKARGPWIKGVIDPAAQGRAQRDGEQLISDYRNQGLNLTPADNAVEAGLYEVWGLLSTGRLKAFSTLTNLRDEYTMYHRDENGKIVKKKDHLLDCKRYLIRSGKAVSTVRPIEGSAHFTPSAGDMNAGY